MLWWIASTVASTILALAIATPIIWHYAARSAATPEAKPKVQSAMSAEDNVRKETPPVDTLVSQRRTAEGRVLSNWTIGWLGLSAVSGIVVVGYVGYNTLYPQTALPPLSRLELSSSPQAPSPDPAVRQLQEFASTLPIAPASSSGSRTSRTELPPVEELTQRLVTRLEKNPKDVVGWRTLGWSYFNLQRFDQAASTYAKAIEANPTIAEFYSARAEALVKAANDVVTDDAQKAIQDALKRDPRDLRARFFDGLDKAQKGEKRAALDLWVSVADEMGPNDALPMLAPRLIALAKELDIDLSKKLTRPLPNAEATAHPAQSGTVATTTPSNAAEVSADQAATVAAMVTKLENRLDRNPRDVEGWIMLMRSRQALKDSASARQALDHALKAFDEPSAEREKILAAAKDLGFALP